MGGGERLVVGQGVAPEIAVVIPVVDRWDDMLRSLDSLIGQSYPQFHLVIVSSEADEIPYTVTAHPRVMVVRLPPRRYFSFGWTRNAGARASQSEWLLFMNADNEWTAGDMLSAAFSSVRTGDSANADWYSQWRRACGFSPLRARRCSFDTALPPSFYGHAHGSVLLVERRMFVAVGGYNERFQDWGFEDTDIMARLECIGCSRVPIRGVRQRGHADEARLARFRHRNRKYTWHRNRMFSDITIRLWGPIGFRHPGRIVTCAVWAICSMAAALLLPWLVDVGSESYTDQES